MTKAEKARIKSEVLTFLRSAHQYNEQDIHNKYPPQSIGDERELKILIWEAKEQLTEEDGIVFGPLRRWPGHYERKDWAQIEKRAIRQRAAGTRKHARAEQKLRIAADKAPDTSKERLNEAADRLALRRAMRVTERLVDGLLGKE